MIFSETAYLDTIKFEIPLKVGYHKDVKFFSSGGVGVVLNEYSWCDLC